MRNSPSKPMHTIGSLKTIPKMRPMPTEITICKDHRSNGGAQYWGALAKGLFQGR